MLGVRKVRRVTIQSRIGIHRDPMETLPHEHAVRHMPVEGCREVAVIALSKFFDGKIMT